MKKLFTVCLLILSGLITKAAVGTEEYIAEHVAFAQSLMHDHKIPASLILAVAIHESASGNSRIAQHLNNHFGIKGPNSNEDIRSSYRDYTSVDESYNHFVEIMETRAPFNNLFNKFDQYDYKGWAKGIQRGGYAASGTWASQVIAIVKKYQLYQFDERPEGYEEPVYVASITRYKSRSRKTTKVYSVKSGDNLGSIAEKHHTTVKAIKSKNGLKGSNLRIGQKLKL